MRYDITFRHYIIYMLTNKVNGKRYIGQHGTNNINDGYMGSGIAIRKAIKEFGRCNFTKEILCFCKDRYEASAKEIEYIEEYGTYNNGYNISKGGEGALGVKHTDEQRKANSERMLRYNKEHPELIKRLAEMARQRTGSKNPFYGHKLTKEHIDLLRRTRVAAITGANNPSAKVVVCIETGEVFGTAKSGAQKMGNCNDPSMIIKVCRGRLKTAYGYHWKYKNDCL